jgi:N-acetylglutamate synthase-like GNAT family acetyltransferase
MMSDTRRTGMSSITDKMVTIRHATDRDRVRVEEYLTQHGKGQDLARAEVVIAAEDERIIGFGIMKKEQDAGCVSLFEDSRRKGIGSSIVRHLLSYEPLKRVYAAHYASYFTNSGFARAKQQHAARSRKSGVPCRMPLMERLAITAYEKT